MVGRLAALLLLLLALASPAAAQAPEELRCIYDNASDEARDRIGRSVWENREVDVPESMLDQFRDCAQRYGWDHQRIRLAGSFAIGTAGLRYLRAQLTRLGVAIDSWDAVYDRTPVRIRAGTRAEGVDISAMRDAAIAAIDADPNAHNDPDVVGHSAAWFAMRANIERSERGWAALSPR